ncbi:ABC transporter ATP-binding protein [Oryzifoliimicrobium ureilyticus]|uniref:ABC transporter ATP-binding protein n=1 Tax=Oryzifoliimicrobium ureilyticus TaxID=3113724 RepID=UPI0030761015
MTESLVSIRDLSITYRAADKPVPALASINLDIIRNERLAVIGESGSGKSTFAHAIADLLPEHAERSGDILWACRETTPVPGRDIGFVFQDPGGVLNPVLRIAEQVADVMWTHLGITRKQAYRQAADLFARLGLPEPDTIGRAFPHQLSGGQKQRVAIAAAIAARPKLLIADEATSALDVVVQAQITSLIDRLVKEEELTLVFVTHDIALAASLADRICVLKNGKMIELQDASDLITKPSDVYTEKLVKAHRNLEAAPIIRGRR